MISIFEYLKNHIEPTEETINEGCFLYCKNNKQFNFRLSSGNHAVERNVERNIKTGEVVSLMRDVWSRFKKAIEDGYILIDQKDSNKSGSSVLLHSTEKTKYGYLVAVVFPTKYHKIADYYDIEVVTTYKYKNFDDYKRKSTDGKTMYHPEHGQLQMWDNEAINYRNKEDVLKV